MTSRIHRLAMFALAGNVLALPALALALEPSELAGSYDCYIYMGSQITYTNMGFTLDSDGQYEWGYEQNGQYKGDSGQYTVQGNTLAFTGAMAESVGNVKPKAQGKPSIELVPNGETWKTMYCSPR